MYNVGDCVVYPMHGAGIIEGIEIKEVLGKTQSYYVMRIPINDMKVMVPQENAGEVGIRDIIDASVAKEVLKSFRTVEIEVIQNWSKRFRDNMERIKSGDIFEVAAVVKSLMLREKQKGLSTGEHKMLSNAKQIMISEIIVAMKTDRESVENQLIQMIEDELENGTNE